MYFLTIGNSGKETHLKRVPNGTMATLEDVRAVVNDTRFQDADVNDVINSLLGALILSEKKRSYDGEAFERVEELVRDIQTNPRKYKDRPSRKVKLV